MLARRHSVYVVDLPGQGYTRLKDRRFRWDLDGMTTALGSFMDAVGVRRAALAGNSWSGGWVLAFAQRHPERMSGLALLDPTALAGRAAWAPLTFHDNLEATYRLERGLDRSQTERALPSTRTPHPAGVGPAGQDRALRLGQLLPDAQVQVLDQCGRAVMLDCPGQVNALLADFLGQRQ